MNKKNVFLFPGQGSQYCGMGKNIYKHYESIKSFYKTAENILGYNIQEISFNGTIQELNKTKFTQPAIFVNSIIKDSILKSNGIFPAAVAGHSLGEFSALVSANIIGYEDALKIIKVRASEMDKAGKKNPGTMAAILGATNEQIKEICTQKEIVVAANYNSNNQTVISGSIEGINNAINTANKIGVKKAIMLNVSGAFHSPLMKFAREKLEDIINNTTFTNSGIPIYQNVEPKPITDVNKIKSNLIKQLENSVQWRKTILNMNNNNLNYFIEVGPGKILSGLNKKIINNSVNKLFKDVINYNNV